MDFGFLEPGGLPVWKEGGKGHSVQFLSTVNGRMCRNTDTLWILTRFYTCQTEKRKITLDQSQHSCAHTHVRAHALTCRRALSHACEQPSLHQFLWLYGKKNVVLHGFVTPTHIFSHCSSKSDLWQTWKSLENGSCISGHMIKGGGACQQCALQKELA